jgi:uncharacterized protein YjiK
MDAETRLTLILANESRRMREAAERVDLVVRALALRRGLRPLPPSEDDLFQPG